MRINSHKHLIRTSLIVSAVLVPLVAIACGNPHLVITKSGPARVAPGATLTYTIHASETNTANHTVATRLDINDVFPAGLVYIPGSAVVSPSPGTYSPSYKWGLPHCEQMGTKIHCYLPSLGNEPNDAPYHVKDVDITMSFTVPQSLACTTLTNRATMSSPETGSQLFTSNTVTTVVDCNTNQCPLTSMPIYAQDTEDYPGLFSYLTPGPDGDSAVIIGRNGAVITNQGDDDTVTFNQTVDIPVNAGEQLFWQGVGGHFNPMLTVDYLDANKNLIQRLNFDDIPSNNDRSYSASGPNDHGTAVEKTVQLPQSGYIRFRSGTRASEHAQLTLRGISNPNDPRCPQQNGCINIQKNAFDANGNTISPVPQFTFKLDNNQSTVNNSNGSASFQSVPAGQHTVSEIVPAGWTLLSTIPTGGTVNVVAGSSCANVTFNNKQVPTNVDVNITKTGPSQVARGTQFTYHLNVANIGQAAATNVVVTDPVPFGLQYVSSNANCSLQGSAVICTLGTLNPQQTVGIDLNFIAPDAVNCSQTTVQNQATVRSDQTDSNQSNNTSAVVTTTVTCPNKNIDLRIIKSADPTVTPGGTIHYSITVTNNGPDTATNVLLDDSMPAFNVVAGAITDSRCHIGTNPLDIICNLGTLNAGQSTQLAMTAVAQQTAPCNSTLTNSVQVSASENDANQSNNFAQASTQVICPNTDISIQKTGPSTATRGSTLSYTLTVTNNTSTPANNVVVTDPVPAGLQFQSASTGACGLQGSNVVCNIGTLQGNQNMTITLNFFVPTVPVEQCQATTVQNQATVATSSTDGNLSNNTSNIVTTSISSTCPQLGCIDITKQAFDANGNNLFPVPQFTFQLDNNQQAVSDQNGIAHFTGITPGFHQVTETLPSGWSQLLVTPANGQVNVVAGQSCAAVTFKNKQTPQNTDISIVKTAPQTAQYGSNIAYSLQVTNNGPTIAQNVVVSDAIPNGLTFVSSTNPSCSQQGNQIICNLGTMTVGAQLTIGLTFSTQVPPVNQCSNATITNTGIVSTTTPETNLNNNQSTAYTTLTCPPPQFGCIDVQKFAFDANGNIVQPVPTFTFKLDNNQSINNDSFGIAHFTNVTPGSHTISEVLPAGWTQLGVQPANGTVNVIAGQSCAAVSFQNKQTPQNTDISIVKTAPATAQFGSNISYSLQVTNNGPTIAQNVVVSDAIPNGLTFVSSTNPSCSPQGSSIICNLGTMNVGAQQTIGLTFSTQVPPVNQCSNTTVINTGIVATSTPETNLNNNQSTAYTTLTCPPPQFGCIDVQKFAFDANGNTVQPVPTFTFKLDNNQSLNNDSFGIAHFTNVTPGSHSISEVLPAGWTQLGVQPANGTVNVIAGQSCAAVSFQNKQTPQNTDISIVKTAPATTQYGNRIFYNLVVTNNGPTTAQNVVVTDAIPSGLTLSDPNPACQLQGNSITCNLGTMTVGAQQTIGLSFSTQVPNPNQCSNTTITNTGIVATSTPETNLNNNQSTAYTSLTCPPPQFGCIDIHKLAYDPMGNPVNPVPQFTFTLDGGQQTFNDGNGNAHYSNVTPGFHTVAEILPAGWTMQSVSPPNGSVNVIAGASCLNVSFQNKQTPVTTDLTIVKSGTQTIQRGDTAVALYTVSVFNSGPANAQNVIITDAFPAGFVYNAAQSDPSCTPQGTNIVCSVGTINGGTSKSVNLAFNVPTIPNCSTITVQNNASVATTTQETNTNNNQASAFTTVTCPPPSVGCIEVHKEAFNPNGSSIPVVPQFSFQLDNGSPAFNNASGYLRFDNVTPGNHSVTETVPTGWSQLLVTPANGQVQVVAGTNCAGVVFKNKQNPVATDLTIQKTSPTPTIQRGSNLSYSIVVTNNGPAVANNVVVTDNFPSELTYIPASSDPLCSATGNVLTCNLGTMNASASKTLNLTFSTQAASGQCSNTTIFNQATVTSSTQDGNLSNNVSAAVTTTLTCPVVLTTDISIQKSGTATIQQGGNVNYTLTVTNSGPASANGVVVTDNVPAGLTFVSSSNPACSMQGQTLTCNIGTMTPAQVLPINLVFSTQQPTASCTPSSITNTGSVAMTTADTNGSNNTSTATTQLTCPPTTDLWIQKYGPASVQQGQSIYYTLVVFNTGPASSNGVVVTDTVPNGLTFDASNSDALCSAVGSTVTCTIGTMTAAQVKSMTLAFTTAQPTASCSTTSVTNVAKVAATSADSNTANNQSTATTQLICTPTTDISIVKTAPVASVQQGNTVNFLLAVSNSGPASANNVVITDNIPAGLTFVSSSNANLGCTAQGQTLTCTVGTMTATQNVTTNLSFSTQAPTASCTPTSVTNTATVTATADSNANNNQGAATVQLTCPPTTDLTITKAVQETTVEHGSWIHYTITVTNSGPASAQNVVVSDNVQSGLTYNDSMSDALCDLQGTTVKCTIGTMTAGQIKTLAITLDVPAVEGTCTPLVVNNNASVASTTTETSTSNNVSNTVVTNVTCPTAGCIDIHKNVIDANGVAIPTIPTFTFKLDSNQSTTSDASGNAHFTNVPAGAHTVSELTQTGWILDSINPPNGNVTIIGGAQCLNVTFTNKQVLQVPDISIVKTGSTSVQRGTNVVYSLAITNNGTTPATGVVVTDAIPAGLTFVSSSHPQLCTVANSTVTCNVGTVSPGSPLQITLTFSTQASTDGCIAGNVSNTATVASTPADSNTSNNTSTASTQLTCPTPTTDISIQKTGPATSVRGNNLTYSLNVTNNGTASAQNVVVTDTFPTGFALVSQSPNLGCTTAGNVVTCNVGTMLPSDVKNIALTFSTPASTGTCTTASVTNYSAVTTSTQDSNNANNNSSFVTSLTCPTTTTIDLQIIKTGASTVQRGNNIVYTMEVKNLSGTGATNVVVTDAIPGGFTYVSSSETGCSNANNTVTCNLGTLAAGATKTFTVTLAVPTVQSCSTTSVSNIATVGATQSDSNQSNNTSTAVTSVTCPAVTVSCIDVVKKAYDMNNNLLNPVPQFSFTLDNASSVTTDSTGKARFANVTAGGHLVTEATVSGWTQQSISPSNGFVTATGSGCVTVTFENKQTQSNDFTITKTDGETEVNAGDRLTYTITVHNNSSSTVNNIQVTDTLPNDVDYVSSTNGGVKQSSNIIAWSNLTFFGNETKTFTVDVDVDDNADDGEVITNRADVAGHTAYDNTTVVNDDGNNDLTITKTDGRTTAQPGDRLVYRITVKNNSSHSAKDLIVTDDLPDEVDYVSASNSPDRSGRFITWDNVTIAAHSSKVFTVNVDVQDDADGVITNTAEVDGETATDKTTINEDNSSSTSKELDLTKEASANEVFAGGIVEYTVTIHNTGNGTIKNLKVVDQLPNGVIIVDDGDADKSSGGKLEWDIDSLAKDKSQTFHYRISAPSSALPGDILRNNVRATASGIDESESVSVAIIGLLPQTGAPLPPGNSLFLRPMPTASSSNGAADVALPVVLSVIFSGLGAGAFMGRRFLFGF